MNLSFYIAKRYLFSKKSHNAINIISLISVCGISIATIALVCTLSVFNGFTSIVSNSFSVFDPDLKVIPTLGKVFDPNIESIKKLNEVEGIDFISESIEENALAKNDTRQIPVLIKGVSPSFDKVVDINRIIVNGDFILNEEDVQYCIPGLTLAMTLNLKANDIFPIELYSPKRNVKINLSNPSGSFIKESVYPSGIFAIHQPKYDDNLMITSIDLARKLFDYETEVSSLDIKIKTNADVNTVKKRIEKLLGADFVVKDRFEQQSDSYRMINIEKWVTFFILSFILLIAAFNIVGSLSMLILDKSNDILILRNMGASNKLILSIFMIEGWLISITGAFIGLVLGVVLCLIQQYFGILKLSQSPGLFIVDAYPVSVYPLDVLYIFITVSLIAFLIVLYPINNLRKKLYR